MLEFEVDQSELDDAIRRIVREFTDPSRLNSFFARASNIIQQDVKAHFRNEEGPDGSPTEISRSAKKWEPLKEVTRKKKIKKHTLQRGILHDSGELKKSITKFHDGTGGGLSTITKYARDHQVGRPNKNLPARPFFWFSQKAVDKIIAAMEKRIVDAWKNK